LAAFTAGTARVLVATDIAARGVHVDDVELVVHCDPPAEHKAYLHRSGRTARAGREGDVVTVVLPEQRRDTKELLRKAGISAAPQQVSADSAPVLALVGEMAPYQAPAAPQPVTPRAAAPRRSGGSGGGGGGGQPRRRGSSGSPQARPARPAQRRRSSRDAGSTAV
jgi:superfamily II DNA/RNA helicase